MSAVLLSCSVEYHKILIYRCDISCLLISQQTFEGLSVWQRIEWPLMACIGHPVGGTATRVAPGDGEPESWMVKIVGEGDS